MTDVDLPMPAKDKLERMRTGPSLRDVMKVINQLGLHDTKATPRFRSLPSLPAITSLFRSLSSLLVSVPYHCFSFPLSTIASRFRSLPSSHVDSRQIPIS